MWNLKRAGDEDVKKDIGECPALCVLFRNLRNPRNLRSLRNPRNLRTLQNLRNLRNPQNLQNLRSLRNLRNLNHQLLARLHDGEGCHHVAEVAVDILVALYVSAAQLTPPYDVVF